MAKEIKIKISEILSKIILDNIYKKHEKLPKFKYEDDTLIISDISKKIVYEELNIILDDIKQKKIQKLKEFAEKIILEKYPLYKQLNAANKIYSEEKSKQIIDGINNLRNIVDEIENQILSINEYFDLIDIDPIKLFEEKLENKEGK